MAFLRKRREDSLCEFSAVVGQHEQTHPAELHDKNRPACKEVLTQRGSTTACAKRSFYSPAAPLIQRRGPLPSEASLSLALFSGQASSDRHPQRMIPDHLLGRVNSIYRLLAWGMIPFGLLLSGLIVRGTEVVTEREAALTAPFWTAALGVLIVTLVGWRHLGDIPTAHFNGDGCH